MCVADPVVILQVIARARIRPTAREDADAIIRQAAPGSTWLEARARPGQLDGPGRNMPAPVQR